VELLSALGTVVRAVTQEYAVGSMQYAERWYAAFSAYSLLRTAYSKVLHSYLTSVILFVLVTPSNEMR
jgi:hypothetical protein